LIIISYLLKGAISLKNKTYINKGSFIAHLGLGLLFFAVSMNSILSYQKNINLFLGEQQFINNSISEFKFLDLQNIKASNHDVVSAEIFIVHDGQPIFLNPEKRKYFARGQITSETAIHASILKDTYLTIGDQLDDGSWTFSLQINYFIKWIWLSSALMVIGILMTIFKKKIS
jgi:cytochrome c-type biogenesis protein CcmF